MLVDDQTYGPAGLGRWKPILCLPRPTARSRPPSELDRRRMQVMADLELPRLAGAALIVVLLARLSHGHAPIASLAPWRAVGLLVGPAWWAAARALRARGSPAQVVEWAHVAMSLLLGGLLGAWWVLLVPDRDPVLVTVAFVASTTALMAGGLIAAPSPACFVAFALPLTTGICLSTRVIVIDRPSAVGMLLFHSVVVAGVNLALHHRVVRGLEAEMGHETLVAAVSEQTDAGAAAVDRGDERVLDAVADAVVATVGCSVSDANDRFAQLVGSTREALRGRPLGEVFEPVDARDDLAQAPVGARVLVRVAPEGRAPRTLEVLVGPPTGPSEQRLWLCRDLTERIERERTLSHLADHDEMTGLLNRRGLRSRLQERVAHGPGPVALAAVMVDLDGLKSVNDRYGHPVGDRLLVVLAERLRPVGRGALARVGGDEFVLIVDHGEAVVAAERAVAVGARPFDLGVEVVRLSVSVGVVEVVAGPDELDLEALLAAADRAMYRAKQAGGGRWHAEVVPSEATWR